ncbi:MAG: glycosyltransferase family 4 protein [Bdellovibrionales bacterium]|nr:glycosyltransferase family 4 protein [Bdellovibrionales bacterium]
MSRVWFDISSLVGWSGPLTGMQRVSVSLIKEYLKLDNNTGLVSFDPDTKCFYEVPKSMVTDLALASQEKNQGGFRRSWRYQLTSYLKSRIPESIFPYISDGRRVLLSFWGHLKRIFYRRVTEFSSPFRSGDKLVALDVTWGRYNYIPYLPYFREKFGLEFFHLVHDIIPIKFPHYYEARFSPHFREHIRLIAQQATGLLVYSENSRVDINQWIIREGLAKPGVFRIHLGSDFGSIGNADEVQELKGKKFCLFVSTLEIRKNHILLLRVWSELLAQLGTQTPYLVFAGRRGWMIQETLDYLKEHPEINQRLVWLQNCSDNQLDWLYRNSFFTLYPSLYEGWGLPVVESLARGKFCLASNTASIPEAGQEFVSYFDPTSVADCLEQTKSFILTPEKVAEREQHISQSYRRTLWSETASELYDVLRAPNAPFQPKLVLARN